jgi:hypothetical protein
MVHLRSMSALSKVGEFVNRFVWVVGLMSIYRFLLERWPLVFDAVGVVCGAGFVIFFVWSFFLMPFMEGYRGKGELPGKLGRPVDGAGL